MLIKITPPLPSHVSIKYFLSLQPQNISKNEILLQKIIILGGSQTIATIIILISIVEYKIIIIIINKVNKQATWVE